jgi:hypothetical protein
MPLVQILDGICADPRLIQLSREADFTSIAAAALSRQTGVAELAFARDYHDTTVVPAAIAKREQYRGRFNTFDVSAADGQNQMLFLCGAKYAREEKTGFLWQFDLLLYDLLVAGLERAYLSEQRRSSASLRSGALVYVSAELFDRRSPTDQPSPFKEFFPVAAGLRQDSVRLDPSVACANPGPGRTSTWPSYRTPTTVARSHISTAVTGGLNPKLVGFFERPPIVLELEYEWTTRSHQPEVEVLGYVVAIDIKRIAAGPRGGRLASELATVLAHIP